MRIAFVARVPHAQGGGVRHVIENLAQGLRQKGHWVEIILGGTRQRWIDFWLFPLLVLFRGYRSRWDVVIAHSADGALLALGSALSRRLPPVIMHSHGWEERAFDSWVRYAGSLGAGPNLKNKLIAKLLRFPLLRLGLRFSQKVVFVAKAGLDWVQETNPKNRSKLLYIHNGYNPAVFSYSSNGPRDSVLFVGGWTWKKGSFLLTPALREITARRPKARISIAGAGLPQADRSAIFGALGLENISFFDGLSPRAMADLYRRSGVLLHLSLYEGGIPCLTLLEAMACGVPVVAFSYAGLENFLQHEKEAILVPVGDAAMAGQKAVEVLSDSNLRSRLVNAGLAKVKDYSWTSAVNQWEKLLTDFRKPE